MRIRLVNFWEEIRSSYWFVPAVMAIAAIGLAALTLAIDRGLGLGTSDQAGIFWGGSTDGARELLSTAAGSTITVAGVVFSIMIVVLSLASSQFGPRLLRQFMRSRTNQVVLGTFVATFIYCLLILRTVHSGIEAGEEFVPHLSVSVSLVLVLFSLGVLIYFIHHMALSIQAPEVVADVAGDLFATIEGIFPGGIGYEPPDDNDEYGRAEVPQDFETRARPVLAAHSGYLQAVDNDTLIKTASQLDLVLRLTRRPGHFVSRHMAVLMVWPSERLTDDAVRHLQRAFIVGKHRTHTQDIEFAIDQLVEVAVRALSPSLNDPFTAMSCIDWLGAALRELSSRHFPSRYRYDNQQRLRVIAEHSETFPGLVDEAFNMIRENAGKSVAVRIRLLEALAAIAEGEPYRQEARDVLMRHADMIERSSREELTEERDLTDIRQRYDRVVELLEQA
jgi:uncharacterized membrane protein